jgi:hypothetical protein
MQVSPKATVPFIWIQLRVVVETTDHTKKKSISQLFHNAQVNWLTCGTVTISHSAGLCTDPHRYYILGHGKINAWRPRSARARDFVNFREKKIMHRSRAARPLGFDSLLSLSDVATFRFPWIINFWHFCLILAREPRFISHNQAEVSKVDYSWKYKSCNIRDLLAAKNTVPGTAVS